MSILIDGHVHIHPAFDLDLMLNAAWANFSRAASGLIVDISACSFVLLLAEGKNTDVFTSLVKRGRHENKTGDIGWNFVPTEESNSVLAVNGEKKIVLIAGRQVISSERLELLALFCPHVFADNTLPLRELADLVIEKGGVPLITWGVGKWLGQRGRAVQGFITDPPVSDFLVGDNGNRPWFWPYPALLTQAERLGVLSLAGSDPLPLASHAARAGSYGGVIRNGALGVENPARVLQRILCSEVEIHPFGRTTGLFRFVYDQIQVNVQKRMPALSGN